MGGTISRYASTGFYSGILHVLVSALVTYFISINCDFKQHFRTASCYTTISASVFCLKTKDYTSWSQLGSEHVLGLRQAAGAVQAHLGVDGAEGLEHADAPKPLVDRTQLEGPARCGGERGVPRAGGWGQGVV